MSEGFYRAECDSCGYSYEDPRRHFVETGADNHQAVYRTHPDDHNTTVQYVEESDQRNTEDN